MSASTVDRPTEADKPAVKEIPSFDVTLRIRRYDPEQDAEAHWEDYPVKVHGTDRVLDALHKIKWEQDGTLTFRRSCAHGVCGSDAMRINGRNRLACKTLLKDLNPDKPITVEPIKGLPVEKDLVVDMEPFFQSYREVMPFLITDGARADPRAGAVAGRPRALRRHHQVHPVRGLHLVAARCSGPTASTSGPPPSSTPTASSSTAATRARTCAWRSSTTARACGAAAPPSTAPRPAPAASRSPRRSSEVKQALLTRRF